MRRIGHLVLTVRIVLVRCRSSSQCKPNDDDESCAQDRDDREHEPHQQCPPFAAQPGCLAPDGFMPRAAAHRADSARRCPLVFAARNATRSLLSLFDILESSGEMVWTVQRPRSSRTLHIPRRTPDDTEAGRTVSRHPPMVSTLRPPLRPPCGRLSRLERGGDIASFAATIWPVLGTIDARIVRPTGFIDEVTGLRRIDEPFELGRDPVDLVVGKGLRRDPARSQPMLLRTPRASRSRERGPESRARARRSGWCRFFATRGQWRGPTPQ